MSTSYRFGYEDDLSNVLFRSDGDAPPVAIGWRNNRGNLQYMNVYHTDLCKSHGIKSEYYNDVDNYIEIVSSMFRVGYHGVKNLSDILFYRDGRKTGIRITAIGYYDSKERCKLLYLDEKRISICRRYRIPYVTAHTSDTCNDDRVKTVDGKPLNRISSGYRGYASIGIFKDVFFARCEPKSGTLVTAIGVIEYRYQVDHFCRWNDNYAFKLNLADATETRSYYLGHVVDLELFACQYLGIRYYQNYADLTHFRRGFGGLDILKDYWFRTTQVVVTVAFVKSADGNLRYCPDDRLMKSIGLNSRDTPSKYESDRMYKRKLRSSFITLERTRGRDDMCRSLERRGLKYPTGYWVDILSDAIVEYEYDQTRYDKSPRIRFITEQFDGDNIRFTFRVSESRDDRARYVLIC